VAQAQVAVARAAPAARVPAVIDDHGVAPARPARRDGGRRPRGRHAATTQENIMQSNYRTTFDAIDLDTDDVDSDELDTAVNLDVETGRITFHAAWALAPHAPQGIARHSVVLALDCDTMARYADLDDGARMRVHAMLHDSVQATLESLSDATEDLTVTVELTDAMLDAARHLQ